MRGRGRGVGGGGGGVPHLSSQVILILILLYRINFNNYKYDIMEIFQLKIFWLSNFNNGTKLVRSKAPRLSSTGLTKHKSYIPFDSYDINFSRSEEFKGATCHLIASSSAVLSFPGGNKSFFDAK